MRCLSLLVFLLTVFPIVAAEPSWPAFRGGSLAGVSDTPLPSVWSKDKNIVWQTDVPGRGWSSPVISGDKVFLTSVTTDGKPLEPRKGLYIEDLAGKTPPGEHRWLVHCLDWKSGKILWSREAFKAKPESTIHIKNSLASETPVTDGERVYALFGNVGLVCYDLDGKEVWTQKLPAYKTRMGWGTAASPALHNGRLYHVNDNDEKSYLAAYDAKTGKELWRVERDEKSNWATPFVWQNELRTEIVTAGTKRVRSYDLDGKLLWELSGMSVISIPTPFAAHGFLYVTSGYVADPFIKPVYAIKPGAKGDISLKKGETSNDWIGWCQKQAGPYHPTPVIYNGLMYVLYDRGQLSCFDAKTGKAIYEKERLPGATAFTASPWAADGKIYCLSEDGDTFVIQAGGEFKVLGKNSLGEMTLATPALSRGSAILRTLGKVYRVGER